MLKLLAEKLTAFMELCFSPFKLQSRKGQQELRTLLAIADTKIPVVTNFEVNFLISIFCLFS